MIAKHLQGITSHIVQVPDSMFSSEKPLPAFDELPAYKNFPGCAWAVWGPDDQLGTVNLLTEGVVKKAAEEEFKYISFESESFYGERPDAITTLFLMKIGKEYFFKSVRYFYLSVFCERRSIGFLLIIGCWLFFVFPADRSINFPEVCLLWI